MLVVVVGKKVAVMNRSNMYLSTWWEKESNNVSVTTFQQYAQHIPHHTHPVAPHTLHTLHTLHIAHGIHHTARSIQP